MKINSVFAGILIGAAVIISGYAIITLLFEFMESTGFMDEAGSAGSKRIRTVWLIAICINVITIQILRKKRTFNTQRGVSIITVLSAFGWFIYYNKSLLFLE